MCDEHTEESNEEFFRKQAELSRRGVVAAGAAVATLTACTTMDAQTTAKGPVTVAEQEVKITTPDGVCDAHFAAPASGKHPAVLVWPDIMGLRPAFRTMGKRLAESGYAVLTINPFYRKQAGQVFDAATEKFSDPPVRTRLVALMGSTINADNNKVDAIACIAWLDKQKQVDTKKGVGTTGYCMGGPLVFRTMAFVPDRVRVGGTFHGGGIATAQPNSPHLLVPQMKAKAVLCCVAQNDDQQDPESKNRLKAAFEAAKIPAEIEVYPAQHGWCPPDSQVYDAAQAEKAWGRLLATFSKALA